MTATQDRAAIAAQFAAQSSPTALGPALASMSEWVTPRAAAMREAGHTYAAELACDLAEASMKPRKPGRLTATVRSAYQSWPVFLAVFYARETWRGLPGPWPVKLALVAICLAIPGPQDEILLLGITQLFRARHARKAAAR